LVKVVLIGVDGATWIILRKLISDGVMPFLAEAIEDGVHGYLRSTIASSTFPSWPTIATGLDPAQHGLTGFMLRSRNGRLVLGSSLYLERETLWDILGYHRLSSLVINYPGTYPAKRIRGFMLTGILTTNYNGFAYPRDMGYMVLKRFGYPLEVDIVNESPQTYIGIDGNRARIASYMIRNYDYDFVSVVFRCSDKLQHHFWNDWRAYRIYYRSLDRWVKEVVESSGYPDTPFLIVSDHGFDYARYKLNIPRILYDHGLVSLGKRIGDSKRTSSPTISRLLGRIGLSREVLSNIVNRYRLLSMIVKRAGGIVFARLFLPETSQTIDPVYSRVYPSSEGLFIMDKDITIDYVVDLLRRCSRYRGRDAINKVYIVKNVWRGPYLYRAPDIIVETRTGCGIAHDLKMRDYVLENHEPLGGHTSYVSHYGVLVASGGDIRRGGLVNASVYDIAPTILDILDLPISIDHVGRPLKEIFRDGSSIKQRAIKTMNYRRLGLSIRIQNIKYRSMGRGGTI